MGWTNPSWDRLIKSWDRLIKSTAESFVLFLRFSNIQGKVADLSDHSFH